MAAEEPTSPYQMASHRSLWHEKTLPSRSITCVRSNGGGDARASQVVLTGCMRQLARHYSQLLACSAVWSKPSAYDCTCGLVRQLEVELPLQGEPSQLMVGPTSLTSPLRRLHARVRQQQVGERHARQVAGACRPQQSSWLHVQRRLLLGGSFLSKGWMMKTQAGLLPSSGVMHGVPAASPACLRPAVHRPGEGVGPMQGAAGIGRHEGAPDRAVHYEDVPALAPGSR